MKTVLNEIESLSLKLQSPRKFSKSFLSVRISLNKSIGLKPIPLEQIRIPDFPETVSTSDPILVICSSSVLHWLISSIAPSYGSSLISCLVGLGIRVLEPSSDSRRLQPVPAWNVLHIEPDSRAAIGDEIWLRTSSYWHQFETILRHHQIFQLAHQQIKFQY